MRSLVTVCLTLLLAAPTFAQSKHTENTLKLDPGAAPGKATFADVSWITGHWTGPGLGGTCEEVWVPPLAASNEMMGMFRFVKDGKTAFSEYINLVQDGESLTMKLKHFDAAFNGWEEKDKHVTFKLIRADKDAVYFHGLTMRKTAEGGLDIFVALSRGGKVSEADFRMKPAKALVK